VVGAGVRHDLVEQSLGEGQHERQDKQKGRPVPKGGTDRPE
jgi:hypothetical protein